VRANDDLMLDVGRDAGGEKNCHDETDKVDRDLRAQC